MDFVKKLSLDRVKWLPLRLITVAFKFSHLGYSFRSLGSYTNFIFCRISTIFEFLVQNFENPFTFTDLIWFSCILNLESIWLPFPPFFAYAYVASSQLVTEADGEEILIRRSAATPGRSVSPTPPPGLTVANWVRVEVVLPGFCRPLLLRNLVLAKGSERGETAIAAGHGV